MNTDHNVNTQDNIFLKHQAINNLVEYAKEEPHSTEHFVQLSSFPLASLSIQNDDNGMGHFFIYEESINSCIIPYLADQFDSIGWEWFNEFFKGRRRLLTVVL